MEDLLEFRELEPNKIVDDLIILIESQLPYFNKSSEFVEILSDKKNENQHSLSFCVFMTNVCQSKYYFGRENAQKGNSVIDIGVYKGSILVFTIEAKILPIPINNSSQSREEFEYVSGKGGGIERFKMGKHGVDNHDTYIPENGMIAFVKEDDFEIWREKINDWIKDAGWAESEKLQAVHSNAVYRLVSIHPRINNSMVKLHHFWVYVQ